MAKKFVCQGCTFYEVGAEKPNSDNYCSCCELALTPGVFCQMLENPPGPAICGPLCVRQIEEKEGNEG